MEKNQRVEDGMLAQSAPRQGWKSTVFIESPSWSLFSFPFVLLSQPHETLISIVHFQFLKFLLVFYVFNFFLKVPIFLFVSNIFSLLTIFLVIPKKSVLFM